MSFATATIQGYVTWIGEMKQTPTGRFVVNLLVAVPDKTKTKSTTYKLSVLYLQTGSVLKYLKKNQLVTAQGTLGLETYGDKPMIRLDFVSILNYGYTPEETETPSKMEFIPIDLETVKSKTASIKATKTPMKV